MLTVKDRVQYECSATCDDCGAGPAFTATTQSRWSVERDLEALGWILATLEIDHWRVTIALCPKCAAVRYEWLREIIAEHSRSGERR